MWHTGRRLVAYDSKILGIELPEKLFHSFSIFHASATVRCGRTQLRPRSYIDMAGKVWYVLIFCPLQVHPYFRDDESKTQYYSLRKSRKRHGKHPLDKLPSMLITGSLIFLRYSKTSSFICGHSGNSLTFLCQYPGELDLQGGNPRYRMPTTHNQNLIIKWSETMVLCPSGRA